MEFEIPQHPEDLESQRAGKLYVRAVLDVENCANIDAVIDGTFSHALKLSLHNLSFCCLTYGPVHPCPRCGSQAYATMRNPCRSSSCCS